MKARSTQAVVGLCGNDSTITRGLGQADSQASISDVEEGLAGVGRRLGSAGRVGPSQADLADVGAGEQRGVDVDRVRRRGHERGVARPDQHPHQVGQALLGPDGGHDLGVGVELDAERAQVQVGDGLAQLGDAPRRRVAVVAGVVGGLGQLLDRDVGRREVGVAEAEVDDVARRLGGPRASDR